MDTFLKDKSTLFIQNTFIDKDLQREWDSTLSKSMCHLRKSRGRTDPNH